MIFYTIFPLFSLYNFETKTEIKQKIIRVKKI